jgi:hypothetical protein
MGLDFFRSFICCGRAPLETPRSACLRVAMLIVLASAFIYGAATRFISCLGRTSQPFTFQVFSWPGQLRRSGIRSMAWSPILAVLLMIGSRLSLMLRFAADYRKDDYCSASRLAIQALAAGQVVWWSADPQKPPLWAERGKGTARAI